MSKFLDMDGLEYYTSRFKPELVDIVDSGAKNTLDWVSAEYVAKNNATYTETDTSLTAICGTLAQASSVVYNAGTYSAGNYVFDFTLSDSNIVDSAKVYIATGIETNTAIANVELTTNSKYSLPFSWQGGVIFLKFYPSATNVVSSNSITLTNFMICTQAAWNISHTFVPYRNGFASNEEIYNCFQNA